MPWFGLFASALLTPVLAEQLVGGLALLVTLAALAGGWLVRGSTAVPAAGWAAAAAAVTASEAFRQAAGTVSPASAAGGRVVVAALLVCPIMSLLGAKRPQHGVWQLIVATLAVVLALPAASAALIRPGSFPDLHLLARFFLPLLVLVGWMNFIGTRRAVAVSLVALGQLGLLWPLLPGVSLPQAMPQPEVDLLAAAAIAAGSLLAVVQSLLAGSRRSMTAARGDRFAQQIDGCLLPLRETLGAAWTLRLAERFAALAEQRGWPVRLTFRGVVINGESDDPFFSQRDATRAAEALFRRFVSTQWLRRHGWWEADRLPAVPEVGYSRKAVDAGREPPAS